MKLRRYSTVQQQLAKLQMALEKTHGRAVQVDPRSTPG
jgi:hypothetical protein